MAHVAIGDADQPACKKEEFRTCCYCDATPEALRSWEGQYGAHPLLQPARPGTCLPAIDRVHRVPDVFHGLGRAVQALRAFTEGFLHNRNETRVTVQKSFEDLSALTRNHRSLFFVCAKHARFVMFNVWKNTYQPQLDAIAGDGEERENGPVAVLISDLWKSFTTVFNILRRKLPFDASEIPELHRCAARCITLCRDLNIPATPWLHTVRVSMGSRLGPGPAQVLHHMPVFYEGLKGLYRFATWGPEAHHKRIKVSYSLSFRAGRRKFGNGDTGAADIIGRVSVGLCLKRTGINWRRLRKRPTKRPRQLRVAVRNAALALIPPSPVKK